VLDSALGRLWDEIAARPDGPMALRFYLQPAMAALYALRDGRRDARSGEPAYLWSLFRDPEHRRQRLRSGWGSIGKIFLIALGLDLVYQRAVLGGLRPLEGLIVAIVLALVPYAALRGPFNRLTRAGSPR
jgi:hypothetical protein